MQEAAPPSSADKEQKVTPWEAHAAEGESTIDYGKLIRKYYTTWRYRARPEYKYCKCVFIYCMEHPSPAAFLL